MQLGALLESWNTGTGDGVQTLSSVRSRRENLCVNTILITTARIGRVGLTNKTEITDAPGSVELNS